MPIQAQSADGVMHQFPDGTADGVVDAAMKQYAAKNPQPSNDDNIDQSGAPAAVRAAVGAVPDNIDARLQAVRKFYPDAQPHGADNFVYTDPKTKKPTLYNPAGLDVGDLASLLPEAGELIGGTAGAVGGTVAGAAGGAAAGSVVPVVGTAAGGVAGGVAGAVAGAGTGATIGREAVQRAAMALMGVKDNRSAGQQVKDAATTFALNAAGEGVAMPIGAAVRAGTKALFRGGAAGQTATKQAIADLDRFGATPSVAQATQNATLDSIESLTAKVPGGAGVIRQAAQQQSQTVAKAVADKLAALNSNVAPDTLAAGKAAQQGVQDFAGNFQDKASVLYGKLDQFIPSDTMIPVTNTERKLAEIITPAAGAPNVSKTLANPKLAALADALGKDASNGAVSYSVMKDLRTSIGARLGSPSLVDDIPRGQLKQVYGALTDDMRIAAQSQGPLALKAFDRASTYYKAGMDRIDSMLTPMVQNKIPEQVFASIETAGNQGPTRLNALRQSVSPEQWRTVAGAVADRLGRSAPGQQGVDVGNFSFQKFLTNWQKLDGGAKDVLFSGPNMQGIRGDMDALARSSERIRDSSKAFANPSGSGGAVAGTTMALAAVGGALTGNFHLLGVLGAAIGTSHMGAKLLTSKPFVHWLAQSTRIAPAGVAAHIGRLSAIAANSDADTRDAIGGYLDTLSATPGQN